MAKFKSRLSSPIQSNKEWIHYTSGGTNHCIKVNGNSCLPNCVGYAWGRITEILGHEPKLSCGNAEDWWSYNDGLQRGQVPKLGAVICWRKGQTGNGSDGAGHVAVVEQIKPNGDIVISQSGYISSNGNTTFNSNFSTKTLTKTSNYYYGSAYTLQGFIYCGLEFDDDTNTNLLPIGTIVKLKSNVKWSNGSTPASWVFNKNLIVTGYSGDTLKLSTQGVNGATTGTILSDKVNIIANTSIDIPMKSYKVNDIIQFKGNTHYTSAYNTGVGKSASPCSAKITNICKGQPHPYHIVGKSVYGWVDADSIY